MPETLRTVALSLATPDPFTILVVRLLAGAALGAVVAVLLAGAGFALAQCRRRRLPVGLPVTLLAVGWAASSGVGTVQAQVGGLQDSVPEIQPRLERLFWADSLRLWGPLFAPRSDHISLSPDGQWLALAAFESADRVNLWLASVSSGRAIRLSRGQYLDQGPAWFPDGKAIAFSSSRPSAPSQDALLLMRMSVSPGEAAAGPPVQLSLRGSTEFAISPDGRNIAHVTGGAGGEALKVMPATGGSPRTVLTLRTIQMPRWGPEGRFLYFLGLDDSAQSWAVMRVPVEGGEAERISTWDPPPWVLLGPEGRYLYKELPSGKGHLARYELASVDGEPVAYFSLPREYVLSGFAGGPTQLIAARQDIVNPLRVLPVFGGPVRQLDEQWDYDVPLGWSGDGARILFRTELNGEQIFMFAPVDGGAMRQVGVPETMAAGSWPILSADGEHVFFLTAGDEEDHFTLQVYDIGDGSARIVDEGLPPFERSPGFGLRGPGVGSMPFASGEGLAYQVTRNGSHEIRLAHPTGSSELLWAFPEEAGPSPPFRRVAIHGTRVAYTECDRSSGECSLFVGEAGGGGAKRLLSRRAALSGLNRPVWSRDGRTLAVAASLPDEDGWGVLLVEIDESGDLVGEPLLLPLDGGPRYWWSLQWLPDGEHFLVCGMATEGIMDTEVWLVSTDPAVPPVPVTADLRESVWNFFLSPDGRQITLESDMPRGASIWRVDLGAVLPGLGH